MIVKKLTENTYLISSEKGIKLGLVFHRNGDYIFTYNNEIYDGLESLAKFINEPNIIYKNEENKEEKYIEGFPIKHNEYSNYINKSYQYKNIRFMIGYWIIDNFRVVLSPKEITAENSIGPFKTKFEAITNIRSKIG